MKRYTRNNHDDHFAQPGGNSALRAAGRGNPRNLPCPTCKAPNRLTPADRARGYQCDACADRAWACEVRRDIPELEQVIGLFRGEPR